MCWIPLYYRASTAPHSDQPRASALSSYSYKGCEGSPQPQPRSPNPRPHPAFVSSSLSTPAPMYRINKTASSSHPYLCLQRSCAFPLECPLVHGHPPLSPPPLVRILPSFKTKCSLVTSSIRGAWVHHQTGFSLWSPAFCVSSVALILF